MPEQRNIILAVALSVIIFIAWTLLFPPTSAPKPPAAPTATTHTANQGNPAAPAPVPAQAHQAPTPSLTREEALAKSKRVPIEAPRVDGSINLTGARLDDLRLKAYRQTTDPKSPTIILLAPAGTPAAYYSEIGWTSAPGAKIPTPGPDTVWQVESGSVLSPGAPVTLKWDNGAGQIFRLTFAVDDGYMFTVTQEVDNAGPSDVTLVPYGAISRFEASSTNNIWFLHEGFAGWVDGALKDIKWKTLRKKGGFSAASTGGWMGFSDKYWLAALAPPQDAALTVSTGIDHPGGAERFAATYELQPQAVRAGGALRTVSHFFAGAKEVKTVDAYETSIPIPHLDLAIDWGWFRFITKPVFVLLDFFKNLTGNFGIAIILATIVMRILFFPLAHRSYESMAKMKKVQPKLKELQERYKDDRAELQKQMFAIYQKEKINPLAGCLPVLLQIPVFYSLYIVLYVTIEMRHQPFGWIQDLSARDPTSLFNLFGLLPYHVPAYLMIGAWPAIYCLTMMVQMRLSPTTMDPSQKMVMTWMPVIFTFMLASFPVGLVIYWTCSNVLVIIQQSVIMSRLGTPPDFAKVLGIDPVKKLISGKPQPPDAGTSARGT